MKSAELVIDIGSKFITINQLGRGIVLKESTAVLLEGHKGKFRLVESGRRAIIEHSKNPNQNHQLVFPVKGGVVLHEQAFVLMFKDFFNKIVPNRIIFRQPIKAIACVSCGLANTEKAQIEELLIKAGLKEVVILESPIATAASVNINAGQLVLDVGASKSEIAIVNSQGIISGCTVNIGGDTFNQAIVDHIASLYRCTIPLGIAEKIKVQVGSLYEQDLTYVNVPMQEIGTNKSVEVKITATDVKEAIEPLITKIYTVLYNISFQIPDNMMEEIALNGIIMSGGSSLFRGFSDYISKAMYMDVHVSEDPTNDIAKGAIVFLEKPEKLSSVLNVGNIV